MHPPTEPVDEQDLERGRVKSTRFARKEAGLFCGSLLRNGEVFACVGNIQNLKDQKGRRATQGLRNGLG